MKEQNLKNLRLKIDNLDEQIQALISTRADLAAEVAKVKKETNTPVSYTHLRAHET